MGNGGKAGRPTVNRPPLRAPSEPSRPGYCFVYAIQSLAAVKIGVTANLYLRLSNIWVDNPHSPILLGHWEMPKRHARRLEAMTKTELADRRLVGDWFDISPELARKTVERLKETVDRLMKRQEENQIAHDAVAEALWARLYPAPITAQP